VRSPLVKRQLEVMSTGSVAVEDTLLFERRTRTRFQLVFPVIFHWSVGTERCAVGYCRNIGLGGIFIVSSTCPPLDIDVEIDVVLPAFNLAPSEILFPHFGRLVRIQPCNELFGFAVAGRFDKEDAIRRHLAVKTSAEQ
jgi:hypothetical protein